MSFRILGLDPQPFMPLFDLDAEALSARGARLVHVSSASGFPCRATLSDAPLGEDALLIHYEHQPAQTPFRASHAIYISRSARAGFEGIDTIPPSLASRHLSLRAFDTDDMLVDAELVAGTEARPAIDILLARPEIAYLHAHYARFGCYAARIERAPRSALQPASG